MIELDGRFRMKSIVGMLSSKANLDPKITISKSRLSKIISVRYMAIYACYCWTSESIASIANFFRISRSTVLHAIHKLKNTEEGRKIKNYWKQK